MHLVAYDDLVDARGPFHGAMLFFVLETGGTYHRVDIACVSPPARIDFDNMHDLINHLFWLFCLSIPWRSRVRGAFDGV